MQWKMQRRCLCRRAKKLRSGRWQGSKSKAKSPFILRYDDIKGLTAKEIANKYALPQIPNRIVFIKLPLELPLEVSLVGSQEKWKASGGSVQYTIKYNLLENKWFENI